MPSSGLQEYSDSGDQPTLPSRVSVRWVRLVWSGWRLVVTCHMMLAEWKTLVVKSLQLRHIDNETTARRHEAEATQLFASWGVHPSGCLDMSLSAAFERSNNER